MKRIFLILVFGLLAFASNSQGADKKKLAIGKVAKIKGAAFRLFDPKKIKDPKTNKIKLKYKKQELKKNAPVFEKDIIEVGAKSFLRVTFIDQTLISLGPKAKLDLHKFVQDKKKRQILFDLIHGKMKAEITKKAKATDDIRFNSKTVSIGVRGTTFLTSAYAVKAKPTTDVLLMTGKVNTSVSGVSGSATLVPKQAMSSHLVTSSGNYGSIFTISDSSLNLLNQNLDGFLPNMVDENGNPVDLDKAIKDKFKKKIEKKLKEAISDEVEDDEEEYEDDEELVFDVNVEVEEESSEKGD